MREKRKGAENILLRRTSRFHDNTQNNKRSAAADRLSLLHRLLMPLPVRVDIGHFKARMLLPEGVRPFFAEQIVIGFIVLFAPALKKWHQAALGMPITIR